MEPTMRRRSILKFKKYVFMFFALLLAIIWVSHYTQKKTSNKVPVQDLPVVKQTSQVVNQEEKPTPRTESPKEKWLRTLREFLLAPDEDEDTVLNETISESPIEPEDLDDDLDFVSKIGKQIRKRKPASRFFVMNSRCKMPDVDLFSEIKEIPNPNSEIINKCSNEGAIFVLKFDEKLLRYRLEVDKTMLAKLEPNLHKYSCSYRGVTNETNNDRRSFKDEVVIDLRHNGIVAECHVSLKAEKTVQEDAFPLVQVSYLRVGSRPHPKKPSVLLLGLGSISRMNFKRNMPKTAKFVEQEGWFEMKGYNKLVDNAFPNLCAILSGTKSEKACGQRFSKLWNAFKAAGYTTAFGEDSQEFPVPPGFRPDHQLSPMLENISQSMSSVTKHCIGRRHSVSYLYDFCMQFAQRLIEELNEPAFGVFWSSTVTNDYLHGPSSLDEKLVEQLVLMREHHVFERAIVILVSDQGQMSGDLVDQAYGYLEERLPMLHIYLPPWFRKEYPIYTSNLLNNSNRLTSPFDLYNTLRHILNLWANDPVKLASQINCRNSQSLLHPMAFDRSCEDACIGIHWCACNNFQFIRNTVTSYNLAKILVSYINMWMVRNKFNLLCERLMLSNLEYSEQSLDNIKSLNGGFGILRMRIRANPKAVFEYTVPFNPISGKLNGMNVKDISNLNNTNSADCVKDWTAKKLCVCNSNEKDDEIMYRIDYKS